MNGEVPIERLKETLARIGINDVEATPARPSLEDVFVTLTRRHAGNGHQGAGG